MNLTLVTSGISLMHMHVQNLFCSDYSVTHFSYSKLTFLTQNFGKYCQQGNSLFLLETHFSYSKLTTQLKVNHKINRVNAFLDKVFVRQNISCRNAIEVPYFSSMPFPAVCYYCGAKQNLKHEEGAYPYCELCTTTNSVPNK